MSGVWQVMVAAGLMVVVAINGQQNCAGPCVSIRECPDKLSLLRQIQAKTAPPGAFNILSRSICGFSNSLPRVCCDDQPNPDTRPTPSGGGEEVLPSVCGFAAQLDYFVDNEDASLSDWPWIALISTRRDRGSTFTCGGVLISERYVLTAAHCIPSPDAGIIEFARLGEHNTAQNPDCMYGVCALAPQDIPIEETIVHEEYSSPCPQCNDIALLRLSRPAIFNELTVQPICLPRDLNRELGLTGFNFTGSAWVAGWGVVHRKDVERPEILKQARLPLGNLYCDLSQYPDPHMVFCAGGENSTDTCRGDSGGPLVRTNVQNNLVILLGITSKGASICGASYTQSIYTNVHYYRPWIIRNLRN